MSSAADPYFSQPPEFVDAGDATLACRRYGQGPALLLVHGFPLNGYPWRKLLPDLQRRHTCYVVDVAGMGDTRWNEGTDFSFMGQARRLQRLVEHYRLERYDLL